MEKHVPKKRFYPVMTRTVITGKKLCKKYGTRYIFMLGNLMLKGIDARTAIWICYNKLEC